MSIMEEQDQFTTCVSLLRAGNLALNFRTGEEFMAKSVGTGIISLSTEIYLHYEPDAGKLYAIRTTDELRAPVCFDGNCVGQVENGKCSSCGRGNKIKTTTDKKIGESADANISPKSTNSGGSEFSKSGDELLYAISEGLEKAAKDNKRTVEQNQPEIAAKKSKIETVTSSNDATISVKNEEIPNQQGSYQNLKPTASIRPSSGVAMSIGSGGIGRTSGPMSMSTSRPMSMSTSGPMSMSTSGPMSMSTSGPSSTSVSGPAKMSVSGPSNIVTRPIITSPVRTQQSIPSANTPKLFPVFQHTPRTASMTAKKSLPGPSNRSIAASSGHAVYGKRVGELGLPKNKIAVPDGFSYDSARGYLLPDGRVCSGNRQPNREILQFLTDLINVANNRPATGALIILPDLEVGEKEWRALIEYILARNSEHGFLKHTVNGKTMYIGIHKTDQIVYQQTNPANGSSRAINLCLTAGCCTKTRLVQRPKKDPLKYNEFFVYCYYCCRELKEYIKDMNNT